MVARAALAAILPLLLFGWVAVRQPVHIDGAMNLQVAHELAYRGDYARFYEFVPLAAPPGTESDWFRKHPAEVQTNGPYIAVAALGLRLFGTSPFGLQFANLVFVAVAAVAIWALLRRRWPNLAVVAPLFALVLLPGAYDNVLGGFGEVPALSFALVALVALAEAARAADERRALQLVALAGLFEGAAIVTKTYLVGSLPAFLVGVVLVARLRPLAVGAVVRRLPTVLAAPVAFELYRLANLGPSAWWDWWGEQRSDIAYQAGVDPSAAGPFQPDRSGIARMGDQLHLFGEGVGLPTVLLLLFVATVLAVGTAMVVTAWRRRPESGDVRGLVTALAVLVVQAALYLAWWVLLVPERKAFERRMMPAMLALLVAGLVIAALGSWAVHRWRPEHTFDWRRQATAVGIGAAALLVVGMGVATDTKQAVTQDTARVRGYEAAGRAVRAAPDDVEFYGTGFWSAPLVSLLADRPVHNLGETDLCTLDPEHDVLIWDEFPQLIYGLPENAGDPALDYELLASYPAVQLWGISRPEYC